MTIRAQRGPGGNRGMTLVELVSVTAIVLLLAGIAIPVASTMVKRKKEMELRRALRDVRSAIDRFQADTERFPQMRATILNTVNEDGYPEEIEWLVEGVDIGIPGVPKLKYMRRSPVDPMTGKREWGTRSSRDRPGAMFSDGINIFDVRSKSEAKALDGTYYRDW